MISKFSHLIRVGAYIHTVDNKVFRCTSKIASSEGIKFCLANLQGKPVPTPPNFRPISLALARFAAWMHIAYNKDFDLYVKAYIQEAGLPVDPAMDWSKFFQARVAPKLMSRDEEVQDEAIHQIIIKTLVERKALANFSEVIKKFPQRIQDLPLEKQVSTYLMQVFNWRIREANDYIKEFIFQDQTNSMWAEGDEESEDVNLLDKVEYNNGRPAEYDTVDADADVATFRRGFEEYLTKTLRNKGDGKVRTSQITQYLALFDVLYAYLREGLLPKAPELFEQWKEQAKVDKSFQWFKVLFSNLPKIIDTYITKYQSGEDVSPFIDVMRQMGVDRKKQETELEPVMGGLKLADEFPINHDIEQDAPSSGSGSNGNNSGGGGGFNMGEAGGEAGEATGGAGEAASAAGAAGEAAAGAGEAAGALAELAPVALLASAHKTKNAAQWEVPKCKSCGKSGVKDCLACHEKFCDDCILNHHANNPSHNPVTASKKKADVDGEPAEPEQPIGLTPPEMQDFIADCVGSGLFESSEEVHFTHQGCDNCNSGGCEVHDCKGFRNLNDAQASNRDELEYEFQLCDECLYKLVYGEE